MRPDPRKIGIRITDEEYEQIKEELPFSASSYDIVYAILMKRQLQCMAHGSVFDNYRVHMDLYNFFQVEKKAGRAVQELIYALYYIVNDHPQEYFEMIEKCGIPSTQKIGLNNFHCTYLCMHIDKVDCAISNCTSIVLPGKTVTLNHFKLMIYNTIKDAKFDKRFTYDDDYFARREGRDLTKEQYLRYRKRLGTKFNYTYSQFIEMKSDKETWDYWKRVYRESK